MSSRGKRSFNSPGKFGPWPPKGLALFTVSPIFGLGMSLGSFLFYMKPPSSPSPTTTTLTMTSKWPFLSNLEFAIDAHFFNSANFSLLSNFCYHRLELKDFYLACVFGAEFFCISQKCPAFQLFQFSRENYLGLKTFTAADVTIGGHCIKPSTYR